MYRSTLIAIGAIFATVAFVAGCDTRGGNAFSPVIGRMAGASTSAHHAEGLAGSSGQLFYAIDTTAQDIWIVDPSGHEVGMITAGLLNPQGLYVDSREHLWVANTAGSDILEFPRLGGRISKTLTDPGQFPVGVAIGADGSVYAANIFSNTNGPGSISVYKPGKTKPTSRLTDKAFARVYAVTVDEAGDVFVAFMNPGGAGRIDEFHAGSHTAVDLGISIKFSGGVELDTSGDLIAGDQLAKEPIGIYPPGHTKPSKTFGKGSDGYFVLDEAETHVFSMHQAYIDVFRYPSGTLERRILGPWGSSDVPLEVVVSPSAPLH